ncbi:pentapeptide repeat-containing protein [Micromonospora musae]|uniref:pentapeptide repeat-containing protein n=1 Tax=Micromonospora musae TaxID=1894970 RepID=UPI00342D93A1
MERRRWYSMPRTRPARPILDGVRLAPIGLVLTAALLTGIGGATALVLIILLTLGLPSLQSSATLPMAGLLDVIKLAFAAIAGIGGTIALVVAYRRQRVAEASSRLEHAKEERDRIRILNERFGAAASQIGSDQPTVRLAGVYAMAALADDWPEQRQTCVNVLCGYLRMPYEPDPGAEAPGSERLAFAQNREVRHAAIQVIRDHLNPRVAPLPWHDCKFDFRGAVFDGGNFSYIEVPNGCTLNFLDASFVGGVTEFQGSKFAGGVANFWRVQFAGGEVHFYGAKFAAGHVGFGESTFSGGRVDFRSIGTSEGPLRSSFSTDVTFSRCQFTGAEVLFSRAEFTAGVIDFDEAEFSGGKVDFTDAQLTGGKLDFSRVAAWAVPPSNLPVSARGLKMPHLPA